MKKIKGLAIILGIIVTMSIVCAGVIYIVNKNHENELADIKNKHALEIQELIEEQNDLNDKIDELTMKFTEKSIEMDNLEEEVYMMMNKNDYKIIIRLGNGETHTYECVKDGLFSNKTHVVTR